MGDGGDVDVVVAKLQFEAVVRLRKSRSLGAKPVPEALLQSNLAPVKAVRIQCERLD